MWILSHHVTENLHVNECKGHCQFLLSLSVTLHKLTAYTLWNTHLTAWHCVPLELLLLLFIPAWSPLWAHVSLTDHYMLKFLRLHSNLLLFSLCILSGWFHPHLPSSSVTTLKGITHTFVSSAQIFSLHSRSAYLIVYAIPLWYLRYLKFNRVQRKIWLFLHQAVLSYWPLCQGMLSPFIQFWKAGT